MRRLASPLYALCIGIAGAVLLTGCMPGAVPARGPVGAQVVVDEQAALAVELAYQAAAIAVLTADRAGLVPASRKADIAELDRRAFLAVLAARSAYDAGNAASYAGALAKARAAVRNLLAAARG